MYYRFKNGTFVEAETFFEAKAKLIKRIQEEEEDTKRWSPCTCTGFQHRLSCPVGQSEPIPF